MASVEFRQAIGEKLAELKALLQQEYPTINYFSATVGLYDNYGYDSADVFITAPMGDFEGQEERLEFDENFEDDALSIRSIRFNHREAKNDEA